MSVIFNISATYDELPLRFPSWRQKEKCLKEKGLYVSEKLSSVFRSQCLLLKTKNVGPHTIRYATATHLLRAGNDINMVILVWGTPTSPLRTFA
jgi:hypothetical protein